MKKKTEIKDDFKMDIYIDNRQEKIEITDDIHDIIEEVLKSILIDELDSLDCEISISLVDNKEIKDLNREYRNIDRETDVLSFPMDQDFNIPGVVLLGDIIISMEKAKEQAEEFSHSLEREIAYLTAHSLYHLLGYDHMEEEEKIEMRKKEKSTMKKLKIFKN